MSRLRSVLAITIFIAAGCSPAGKVVQFIGNAWGTTYHVSYVSAGADIPKDAVEDMLSGINQSMSTYIDTSLIARINSSEDTAMWFPIDKHFETVYRRSREVYRDTGGAFNPAVGPLVNGWGFGPE